MSTPGASATTDTVLAVIPARSGSRGLKDKNILPFNGLPLMAHSIRQGLAASSVGRVIVSTDSQHYADLARAHGAEAPFLRPAAASGDLATDLDAFLHLLGWLDREEGWLPDLCVHLRPTHPIRDPADIDRAVAILNEDPSLDSVRSVVPAPQTPLKMWWRDAAGRLTPVATVDGMAEAHSAPRQSLPTAYLQNASIDVVRTRVILEQRSMTGTAVHGLVLRDYEDVDSRDDFMRAERVAELQGRGPFEFVFDIDGVVATTVPGNDYSLAQPIDENVALINRLYAGGHRIVLFTARGSKTGRDWQQVTRDQMARWQVQYHELRFGKPAAHCYVDDRMLPMGTLLSLFG